GAPRRGRRRRALRSRRPRTASRSLPPSARRRTRTAARRGRPAPSPDSAPRRSTPGSSRPRRSHFVLDPSGVLLERARLGGELDDLLLPVERVLPPDVHMVVGDLDQVVTGARLAAEALRGDGAG